jgi:hypothetical protein
MRQRTQPRSHQDALTSGPSNRVFLRYCVSEALKAIIFESDL